MSRHPGVAACAVVPLRATEAAPEAAAVIQVGERDEKSGNWENDPRGHRVAEALPGERYYSLWLEKDGENATCGSFNVGEGTTTVHMTVSYRLSQYDAWVISEHNDDTGLAARRRARA